MYAYTVLALSTTLFVSLSSATPMFPRGILAKSPESLRGGGRGPLDPYLPIYKDKRQEHGLPGFESWVNPSAPETPSPSANTVAVAFEPETPNYKEKRQEKGLLPGFQPAVYPSAPEDASAPEMSNGVGTTLQPTGPEYKEKRQELGLLPGFQPAIYPDAAPAKNGPSNSLGVSTPDYKKRQMMEIPPARDIPTASGSSAAFSPTPEPIPLAAMNVGAALEPDLPIYKN